jgi:hypothetical protein
MCHKQIKASHEMKTVKFSNQFRDTQTKQNSSKITNKSLIPDPKRWDAKEVFFMSNRSTHGIDHFSASTSGWLLMALGR